MNISLRTPFSAPPPSWVVTQTPKAISTIEVLTLLRGQRLKAQSISATEILTSLGDQMSICSKMKTPSGDGNADTSYSCHPKVRPPKGYDYSTIQITARSKNSVIFITKHMQLHFIMSLHLTSGIHEITLHLCVYFLKKKYRRYGNQFCHHLQIPYTRTRKTCSLEEIFSEAVFLPHQCHGT